MCAVARFLTSTILAITFVGCANQDTTKNIPKNKTEQSSVIFKDGSAVTATTNNNKTQAPTWNKNSKVHFQFLDETKGLKVFIKKAPNGKISSFYAIPENEELPATFLKTLGAGDSVLKVSGETFFGQFLPSKTDISNALTGLLNDAIVSVCKMEKRPNKFGTQIDISASVGVGGRLVFSAEWNTADLCN